MTAILAASPDYALMNIFTVAVIGAAAVACAISLRKSRKTT